MDSPVQKIKERLAIEEVVSSYIKLEKSGVNFKARCPFHNEKTPSFFISPGRGSFYCFGCSRGGDIFTFVQEFEGLDFMGTLRLLASRAGVSLEHYDKTFDKKNITEKEKILSIMESATSFFELNLQSSKEGLDYLKSRGLSNESIKNFRIGLALPGWRSLYEYLKSKGFLDADIEKAGLIKRIEKAEPGKSGFYDRFRGRIMFPITDSSGRIIAFSGRILESIVSKEEALRSAKYVNSPETPVFSKSSVLFGIDKAKDSIRKNNFSILVEGQLDLILSHQAGFKNTVASSGTALSEETVNKENIVSNLGLVRRLSSNIVLAFDADRAGLKASGRAGKIALSFGMDVKVASLPEGVDPADLISKQGADAWREAVRKSTHLIEFFLNRALLNVADPRKALREVKDQVLPYVLALDSDIEKSHFLKLISDRTGIPVPALNADLSKLEKEDVGTDYLTEKDINSPGQVFRKEHIQKRLFGIVLWQQSLETPKIDVSKVKSEIESIYGGTVWQSLDSPKEDLIFEAEVFYQGDTDIQKDVLELIDNLKEESLKEELENKMLMLRKAENEKNIELSGKILKECKEISEKIQNIKNKRSQ